MKQLKFNSGYGGKEVKTTIKRVSKRTLSIVLTILISMSTMLIGMVSTNAVIDNSGYIYFVKPSNWTSSYVEFMVGHSSFSRGYDMKLVPNTDNLYACQADNWGDATEFAFFNTSGHWDDENSTISHRSAYADNYTAVKSGYNLTSKQYFLAKPTTDSSGKANKGAAITMSKFGTAITSLNNTQTFGVRTAGVDSDSYTAPSSSPATVSLSGYYFSSSYNSTTSRTASVSKSSPTNSNTASIGYLAKVTLSYSNLDSNYQFVGWYNSNSVQLSASASYTYYPTAATTVYAHFKKLNYDVSAQARYQDYDPNTDKYKAIANAPSSVGTATANPTSVKKGTSTTLSANVVNPNYEFAGWYTNSACSGDSISSNLTHSAIPTGDVTYYALFKEKKPDKYDLSVQNADTVTVTAKYNNTTVAEGQTISKLVPAGATVTVNISGIPNDKKCTVSVNDGNVSVTGSGSSYTFTMPDANATVVVTLADKQKYTVTAKSNNNSYGTVSPASKTVYEGDSLTVTATAKSGYTFKEWTASGVTLSQKTNKSLTLTNINSDIKLTANFIQETGTLKSGLHLVYGTNSANTPANMTSNLSVYELSDKKFVARIPAGTLKKNTDYYFALSSSTKYSEMYWQGWQADGGTKTDDYAGKVLVKTDYPDDIAVSVVSNSEKATGGTHYFHYGHFKINSDIVESITIVVGEDDGKGNVKEPHYEVVPIFETVPDGSAAVYVKDGTVASSAKTTSIYGETTIKQNDGITLKRTSADYRLYFAKEGSIFDVTTTLGSTYKDKYFVYAYVVNGDSYYLAEEGSTDGEYSAEIPVEAGEDTLEITPIYYVKDCKTEGKYITVYVDLKDTDIDDWDETLAGYSSYLDSVHGDGDLPGQPLLYNDALDKYFCRVAKNIDGTDISGITFNNYNTDTVHKELFPQSGYEQTYDYAAFENVNSLGIEVVEFDIHPRTSSTTNKSIVDSEEPFDYETYEQNNGWDTYTNINGEQSDPLGNPVTSVARPISAKIAAYKAANISSDKVAYIVSVQADDTVDNNLVERYIYDQDGTFITKGEPSDFIERPEGEDQTDAYKAVVDAGLVGAYTEITYESKVDNLVDGRWYYRTTPTVTADVKYQKSNDGEEWTDAPVTDANVASINGDTSVTFESTGQEASLVAKPLKDYVFSGWATVDANDNYRELTTDMGSSFTTLVDNDTHYVARYVKATAGQLVLTHGKFAGPDAKGGVGYYTISAKINRAGSSSQTVTGTGTGATGQSIILKNISSSDTSIEITLTTTPSGDNTFRYWYGESEDGYKILDESAFGETGVQTHTFTVPVSDLFTDGLQTVTQLDYYSDITPISRAYQLTYNYTDRFGNPKSYVVRGEHDGQYYADNHNSWAPTEELIYKNAPAIDDLYKDCKWIVTETSIDGTFATLEAVQDEKKYTVQIKTSADGVFDTYSLPLNSYVQKAGEFYVVPETSGDKEFSYWSVTEDGKEVARHYSRYFTLKVAGNYVIEPVYGAEVKDDLYISDAQYSREQYTDSTGTHDYVYADFIIAFLSSDGTLLNASPDSKSGILVEVDRSTVLTDDDIRNGADYSNKNFESSDNDLKNIAKGSDSKTTYNYNESTERTVFNFIADNTKYNNMNRLDYFVKFGNTENNRKLVLKAYYYVIINEEVKLSDPVYFNFYDIGTQSADTGE